MYLTIDDSGLTLNDFPYLTYMPIDTHYYSNNDITVVWKPGLCKHSTNCWKGLNTVFNPKLRPWINMDGADTLRIIEQVNKCPTGALSYYPNNKENN